MKSSYPDDYCTLCKAVGLRFLAISETQKRLPFVVNTALEDLSPMHPTWSPHLPAIAVATSGFAAALPLRYFYQAILAPGRNMES